MTERPTLLPVLPSDAVFDDDDQPTAEAALAELVTLDEGATEPQVLGASVAVAQRVEGAFAVADPKTAEWAMRRLAEASIRFDEVRKLYDGFVAQLDAWFERVGAPHRATIGFFTDHLEDYGRRWIDTQPKSAPKSLALPAGVIQTRTTDAKAEVLDSATVQSWAMAEHPEIVNRQVRVWVTVPDVMRLVEVATIVDPDADELITKSVVVDKATGQVVPGLGVKAKHTAVTVTAEAP